MILSLCWQSISSLPGKCPKAWVWSIIQIPDIWSSVLNFIWLSWECYLSMMMMDDVQYWRKVANRGEVRSWHACFSVQNDSSWQSAINLPKLYCAYSTHHEIHDSGLDVVKSISIVYHLWVLFLSCTVYGFANNHLQGSWTWQLKIISVSQFALN